ncbi:unnamed protein product [Adineta steineri]|uniref:G-protein coupled receptors family 1 profile domain-containing protein n=1 Tax=Adineta steineri TaxID=433720 RepID=A0A814AHC7_9BILA|nr:unnamed protein product [Adineta steineri]CAF1217295.1 unnamed protein product [Adineta steineri]CAF1323829.1 unnamed protein product [Adineta steineri]
MNTTMASNTTTASTLTTTIDYSLLLVNRVATIRIYQIGYTFTFLLGFPGNIASLITFSRPTLRKVSTGCLFIVLAISDTLYLLMCVIDYLEFGFKVSYQRLSYDDFCRFRTFVMCVSQIASAWILVIVSLDRWIRTRFPFKSGSLCTPKNALLTVGVMLVVDMLFNAPLLTPLFGGFIPGLAIAACGPSFNNLTYFFFYYLQWSIIQIFTTCIIPATIMSILIIDISISTHLRRKAMARQNQAWDLDKSAQRKNMLQRQMFILMFGSVCIFLITSLPVGLYKIVSPRNAAIYVLTDALDILIMWTGFGWSQSLLYAVSFYVHCLSSNLFRKEFMAIMRTVSNRIHPRTEVIEITQRERRTNIATISRKQ